MANIHTSKTRRRGRESADRHIPVSRSAFVKQKREVECSGGGNLSEYLYEKRIQELTRKGYGVDAICGMMKGESGSQKGEKGEIENIMKRTGGTIKLDGNI